MTRIGDRIAALLYRVDDHGHFVVFDHVNDIGAAFGHLVDLLHGNTSLGNRCSGAFGGQQFEAQGHQLLGHQYGTRLVAILDREEHLA